MRKDLNMRRGKMIAQGAHASTAVALHHRDHPYVEGWLAGRFAKIVVYVNSEDELLDIQEAALVNGQLCELIEDAGFTEFGGVPTLTCLAVGPGPVNEIDGVTGGLKLL